MTKQDKQIKTQQTLIRWLLERRGEEEIQGKGDQIYDDERTCNFGWWAHDATYR